MYVQYRNQKIIFFNCLVVYIFFVKHKRGLIILDLRRRNIKNGNILRPYLHSRYCN